MERTDSELLAALSSGDRRAFEDIYHRHKRRLYSYCLRMLNSSDAAQDVVHHVFVTLLEQHRSIRQPEKLCGWLLTIASHRCHRVLAERARYVSTDSDNIESHLVEDTAGERVSPRLLSRALEELSPEMREMIILREYEDMSYKEIAEVLQVNESTVKFRLHTARKKLCELVRTAQGIEDRYELR